MDYIRYLQTNINLHLLATINKCGNYEKDSIESMKSHKTDLKFIRCIKYQAYFNSLHNPYCGMFEFGDPQTNMKGFMTLLTLNIMIPYHIQNKKRYNVIKKKNSKCCPY